MESITLSDYDKTRHALLDGFGCSAPEGQFCGGCHNAVLDFEWAVEAQMIERFRQVLKASGFVHEGNWPSIQKAVRETVEDASPPMVFVGWGIREKSGMMVSETYTGHGAEDHARRMVELYDAERPLRSPHTAVQLFARG